MLKNPKEKAVQTDADLLHQALAVLLRVPQGRLTGGVYAHVCEEQGWAGHLFEHVGTPICLFLKLFFACLVRQNMNSLDWSHNHTKRGP